MNKIILGLLIIFLLPISGCTYQPSSLNIDLPIITPGAIDRVRELQNGIDFHIADWSFDNVQILLRKGFNAPPEVTDHDLALFNKESKQINPLKIKVEKKVFGYSSAQGKNGLIAFDDGDYKIMLYDTISTIQTLIGKGQYPGFSLNGENLAFRDGNKLIIFNLRENRILKIIESPHSSQNDYFHQTQWRKNNDSINFIYTSMNGSEIIGSEIREVNINTQVQKTLYQSIEIKDFSWSPDGNLLALIEHTPNKLESTLIIFETTDRCEVKKIRIPDLTTKLRWSPSGDEMYVDFSTRSLNIYRINVQAFLGSSFDRVKCADKPNGGEYLPPPT
jgi:hypothetical protein